MGVRTAWSAITQITLHIERLSFCDTSEQKNTLRFTRRRPHRRAAVVTGTQLASSGRVGGIMQTHRSSVLTTVMPPSDCVHTVLHSSVDATVPMLGRTETKGAGIWGGWV